MELLLTLRAALPSALVATVLAVIFMGLVKILEIWLKPKAQGISRGLLSLPLIGIGFFSCGRKD
ncbi:MAG: hypothetical protein EXR29_11025 [Betaproteobacteria bacterium]|nr:hypothetical protein [Betaproteobacteria bacterium]